jgi:Na+-driven multidrug efflux pump
MSDPAIAAAPDARTRRLLGAPVLPTLVRMAAPNVLVMLAQTSVGIIESYFVARALGRGRREQAAELAWYALLAALALGALTTVLALPGGPALYRLLGGRGEALDAALTYSHIVFGGALLVWIFNRLAAVIRGTGDMLLPTIVVMIGAAALLPLSPALIFGWGPLPRMGVAGGAVAVLLY